MVRTDGQEREMEKRVVERLDRGAEMDCETVRDEQQSKECLSKKALSRGAIVGTLALIKYGAPELGWSWLTRD